MGAQQSSAATRPRNQLDVPGDADSDALEQALPELNEYTNTALNDRSLIERAKRAQYGQFDAVVSPTLPFFGWSYTRCLVWGFCPSDTEVLARLAHPQLVLEQDLRSYHRIAPPFPVYVNYPGFGVALASHYEVQYATTRLIVYLVVQKVQPFGLIAGTPYGSMQFYRVYSEWCMRLPAAVIALRPDAGDAVIALASGNEDAVLLDDLRAPREGRVRFARALGVARAMLLLDWPTLATPLVGLVPTRVFYADDSSNNDQQNASTPLVPPQQQQQQQQTVNVRATTSYIGLGSGQRLSVKYDNNDNNV